VKNAKDALEAVANAAAALNYAATMQGDGATLGTLAEPLQRLSRAVARVEVLLTINADTPLGQTLSERSFSDQDRLDQAMTIDALETAAAMPSEPVMVALRVRPLEDGSVEDALRQWLNGQHFVAHPGDHRFDIDANRLAANIAERFLPPTD